MYAIRSYYVRRDGHLILRLTSPDGGRLLDYLDCSPDSLRFLERIAKVPPEVGFSDRRITSYNVCYTKLLRKPGTNTVFW